MLYFYVLDDKLAIISNSAVNHIWEFWMLLSTEKLKELRRENGWSQEVLAKATGLSVRTIQRIESDGRASAESTLAISSVFNSSPQSLMALSKDIQVNWTRDVIMKRLVALIVISGASIMLALLSGGLDHIIDGQSGLFLVLFVYAATIISYGIDGMFKSIICLKYLFTDELVGGSQAKYLSEIFHSQIKFLYGGALVGLLIGSIAMLGNISSYDNFIYQRATSVNLVVFFYAALVSESILRPLSLKLKHCDLVSN